MNLTISPLIRTVAFIGVGVIVLMGGAVMVLGRSHAPATPTAAERHGSAAAAAPATHTKPAKVAASATTAAPATHVKATTPAAVAAQKAAAARRAALAAQHAAVAHEAVVAHDRAVAHKAALARKSALARRREAAKYHGNPVYANLPMPLQWQLAHHKVVVVSFYNPNADVDAISVAEAHAGATAAGAGYLLVNVLDNKVAGILTALLPSGGLLPDPGVIIYHAPGTISVRIDGFADRDSVAQAASNAFSNLVAAGAAPAATASTTAAAAPSGGVIVTP